MVKRINISVSDHLYEKLNLIKNNLNISQICQKALSEAISIQKNKQIYRKTGFEDGNMRFDLLSELDSQKLVDILKGHGKYGLWNDVERTHEAYERYVNPEVEKIRFGNMERGALLIGKDIRLTDENEISEAFYEYKKGWSDGIVARIIPTTTGETPGRTVSQKKDALELINTMFLQKDAMSLNSKQLIFSNKNKANDKWWFEPAYAKFNESFYIALNDPSHKLVYLFRVPENEFPNYKQSFRDRPRKMRVSVIIEGDDKEYFRDTNSGSANICFRKYLVERINYNGNQ